MRPSSLRSASIGRPRSTSVPRSMSPDAPDEASKYTTRLTLPAPTPSRPASQHAALLQAHEAAGAEHEVIEDVDAHERAGGREPPREGEILGRRLGVAGGMVVEEHDRGRARG